MIKQYLKLSNETRTPQELEDLFINTGISVDGNENHSRIDPYLTYLNLSWSDVSIIPKKLEFILEPNSTGMKNITIISEKNLNITVTFANLSNDGQVINNSNIFAWVDGNLSHNATGNETLIINNTNVTEMKGEQFLNAVVLDKPYKGSNELKLDALFIQVGQIPLSELAASVGAEINEKKEIIIIGCIEIYVIINIAVTII